MDGGQRDEGEVLDALHRPDRYGYDASGLSGRSPADPPPSPYAAGVVGPDDYHHHHHATASGSTSILASFSASTSTLTTAPTATATATSTTTATAPPQSQPFPLLPDDADLADPGDFYRSHTSNNTDSSHALSHPPIHRHSDAVIAFTAADLMAASPVAAMAAQQQHQHQHQHQHVADDQPSSPQPRHPPHHTHTHGNSNGNGLRSGRSVSSPIGTGVPVTNRTRATGSTSTSVKDLKKRFDQINAPGGGVQARSRTSGASSSIAAPSGPSSTRAKTPTASRPPLQSPVSPNSSFSSRIGKPRTTATSPPTTRRTAASSSLSSLSTSPPPASAARLNSLLFGEILPENIDTMSAGYGIDSVSGSNNNSNSTVVVDPTTGRPRRTSESGLASIPRTVHGDILGGDANGEPDSPTDWYRSATTTTTTCAADLATATSSHSRSSSSHRRAHSETPSAAPSSIPLPSARPLPSRLITASPTTMMGSGLPSYRSHSAASLPQSPTSPTSRIPVSVRKLSSASNSSSSRSDSPTFTRRTPVAGTNKTPRQSTTASHPPVSANNATALPKQRRAATPTSTPRPPSATSSRKPPPSINNGTASHHLMAYATPQPKLSPPLRSSRPRQPVSSALVGTGSGSGGTSSSSRLGRLSAASSSSSSIDRGRMQYASSTVASAARQQEQANRAAAAAARRKIDVGPIDFAQRRETIRLKYSKSIRETEAVAARQAAAEKRKKELEAAARAKTQAEVAVRKASSTLPPSTGTDDHTRRSRSRSASRGPSRIPSRSTSRAPSRGPTSRAPSPAPPPVPALPTAAAPVEAEPSSSASLDPTPEAVPKGPPALSITTHAVQPETAPPPQRGRDSPTLGIPGTFPENGSPPVEVSFNPLSLLGLPHRGEDDHEEAPPSATSQHSVETEFDNEPQTEPPERAAQMASPQVDGPVESKGLGIESPRLASPPPPPHQKAVYQYPFEDEEAAAAASPERPAKGHRRGCSSLGHTKEGSFGHKKEGSFSLMHAMPGAFRQDSFDSRYAGSPQEVQTEVFVQSPALMGSRGDTAEAEEDAPVDRTPESVVPTAPAVSAPPVPEAPVHAAPPTPEYVLRPFEPDTQQPTSVTILGREMAEFPAQDQRAEAEAEAESTDDGPPEAFYGPSLRDNIAALRSTLDQDTSPSEAPSAPPSAHPTPEMSNSLAIPALPSSAHRSSAQPGWTDFSVESGVYTSAGASEPAPVVPAVPPVPPVPRLHRNPYQFDSRPDSIVEEAEDTMHQSTRQSGDQSTGLLPELDIQPGTSFFLPYLSEAARSPIPELPDHSPPPIPVAASNAASHRNSMAESSAYYDDSRPNSFALGHDGGHDEQREADDAHDNHASMASPSVATVQPLDGHNMSGTTLIDERPGTVRASDATRPSVDGRPLSQPGSVKHHHHHQAASTTSTATATSSKEQARLVQRQMVIRELVDTEAVFVRDMNIVEEIYKGTAEACPQLDANTVKLIFRNTDEIIAFHTAFLVQLKEAVASVYAPKQRRPSPPPREDSILSEAGTLNSTSNASVADTSASSFGETGESDDVRDRRTAIGPVFSENIDQMRVTHEGFLRSSDSAAKRLIQIQEDPTVKLWLAECNEVAQDLTAAWNLDSLLIKPMQRITKYPNLISQLLQYTPEDHPDRAALVAARTVLETAILDINKTKKNHELVGQIVGRKRKDSDVRAGFARAFGKRVDKLHPAVGAGHRPPEDAEYVKLHEKYGDDYLRLQVVLRDVEFYTRQVSAYVHEFLQLLSAMELVMRLQPSPYPELESKWARFNVSMRDMEKVALDQHLAAVRKQVIEPFELVIKCYGNPGLAMKKRAKRRLDYERAVQLKKGGKKVDKQLAELVEQYEALNEALKKELPKLSANTERIGNICLGNLVSIQVRWFAIWKDKVRTVLEDLPPGGGAPAIADIVSTFTRDFTEVEDHVKQNISLVSRGLSGFFSPGGSRAGRASDDTGRSSFSPSLVGGTSMLRSRSGQPTTSTTTTPTTSHSASALGGGGGGGGGGRLRDGSLASDGGPPMLPPPDFGRRHSGGHFPAPLVGTTSLASTAATTTTTTGMPSSPSHQYYTSYRSSNTGSNNNNDVYAMHSRGPASPMTPGLPTGGDSSRRSVASSNGGGGLGAYANGGGHGGRPGTGRSYDSSGPVRPSMDSSMAGTNSVRPSMDSALSGGGSTTNSFSGRFFASSSSNNNATTAPGLSALVAAAGAAAAGVGSPMAGGTSMGAGGMPMGWRDSSSTYNSNYQYAPSLGTNGGGGGGGVGGGINGNGNEGRRRFSGLFQSALPPDDDAPQPATGAQSSASSAAASQGQADSHNNAAGSGVLWLAASLFEFNIETKHEAGYPYLTYQAGEIFDVIAEKGELWLAKNQDDADDVVGWIWSKHFAKLAE